MIGKIISHYKILEKLGEGGMGIVYKAYDTTLDRTVALKFLPHYLTTDQNEKERFYHEARAASALMHQNVAVIHEISEHDGQLFIVMEYVEGKTLKQIIEQDSESLSIKKVLDIAIQICDGLTAAHEKGIVHRDIKSDNIMITAKGQVKIMDFGLAKIKGATKLTKEGSTVGTAAYMSPEQTRGEDVDQRSDIFSFGVVLYEMLTSHLPFKGDHQAALFYSVMNEEPQPLARYNDKVTQEFEHIVFKALEKDRAERYQHADDMLADLRKERKNLEYARSGYVEASTITQQSSEIKVPGKRKNLRIIIPAGAVIILVLLFLIFNPFSINITQNAVSASSGKTLAIMYFENIPDPGDKDHTGEMLTNLLITSLSQAKGMEVISRERLMDIQKDIGQTKTKGLSPELAGEVAKRAGASTMLIGSILQKKPSLAVTTRLIDVQTGNIISSEQVTNFSSNQIFNMVDSLSYLLQKDFNVKESETEIKPVAEVTTKSPAAYRAYVTGLDLDDKFYHKEAIAAYKEAIKLDSNFAMAYFKLSIIQKDLGYGDLSWKSFQKAVALSDNTPDRERLQILAVNYVVKREPVKAIKIFEKVIERYPHDIFSYTFLSAIYRTVLFTPENGIVRYRHGLKNNPSAKILWNELSYSYTYLNKKNEALNAITKYINLTPAEPNPYDSKGDLYAWFMQYDSSRVSYQKAVNLKPDFSSATKLGYYYLLRQKYEEAGKYFQMSGYKMPVIEVYRGQIKSSLENSTLKILNTGSKFERTIHLYYETDRYKEMLKLAENYSNILKEYPHEVLVIYGRDYLAWALAKNKRFSEAHSLVNSVQSDVNGTTPRLQARADYISALILFEEGKYEQALSRFKKVFDMLPPNHEPNIFYSMCLLKCEEISKAIHGFKRLQNWPGNTDLYVLGDIPGSIAYWPIQAVKAHYWLGVAYEQLGQKEKASREYEEFLNLWKDADFNSPEIRDTKIRVSKLREVTLK
jgi:serine/threonine protein kinase/tetratricopeptide (TPR) repeat protein